MKLNLDEAYENMSEAEVRNALFLDPLTDSYNRRAYDLSESDFVAIVDIDSLKWVNDNLGHRQGDELLRTAACALSNTGHDVFRLSGDEFAVRGNEYSLWQSVGRVQDILGTISVGVGKTLVEADELLRQNKLDREVKGLRSPRGVRPPWMKVEKI